MKAKVNVNPNSSYSVYNGQIFTVINKGNKTATLQVFDKEIDFSLNEIEIQTVKVFCRCNYLIHGTKKGKPVKRRI